MNKIKNDIKNDTLKGIYIFTGEEEYLIDYYTRKVVEHATESDTCDLNVLKLCNTLPDEGDIDAFVNSYPFMSEKKILILRDTKILKKASESHKNFFSELATNLPDYMIIIFAETEIDKRSSLYKSISKHYSVCEFKTQTLNELTHWITKLFESYGKSIASEDASYMCEIAGPSMFALKSEAEKVVSFCKDNNVSRETIDALVTRNIENRVFAMIDDIAKSDSVSAMRKLSDLKALNEEPIKIINIMFNKFATFHKLLTLKGKSIREAAAMCGLYETHAKNNLNQAQKLGARTVASVMLKCRDMDFAVKNGTMDKWLAVELVISEALIK